MSKIRLDLTPAELAIVWDALYPTIEPRAEPAKFADPAAVAGVMSKVMVKLTAAGFTHANGATIADSNMSQLFASVEAAKPAPVAAPVAEPVRPLYVGIYH